MNEKNSLICILYSFDTDLDIGALCQILKQSRKLHSEAFWPIDTKNYPIAVKNLPKKPNLVIYLNENKTTHEELYSLKQTIDLWQTIDIPKKPRVDVIASMICACMEVRSPQKLHLSSRLTKLERSPQM